MNIVAVGVSHKTAPVAIREKLSISEETSIESAIAHLLELSQIEEVAIISTCNRLEIYAVVKQAEPGIQEIKQFLAKIGQIPLSQLQQHSFNLVNEDAVFHLMRVATGLDSLVIGEGQILCQVKKAYRLAQTHKGFKKILEHLFKQAITAGKKIRHETKIAAGAVSISSAAVELAQMKLQNLKACNIALIGAGKMSRLLIRHLEAKDAVTISIVNRSLASAEKLTSKFPDIPIQVYPLSEMMNVVAKSDIVFASTNAPKPLLDRVKLERVLPKNHPLILFDISVPRNVNPDVNELENVAVYNVDDLQAVVTKNQERRYEIAREAEVLLKQEFQAFLQWWRSQETLATIISFRKKIESIGEQELRKTLSRSGNKFSQKDKELIESLTKRIIKKILHSPTVQIRTQPDLEVQRVVRMLFNLEP